MSNYRKWCYNFEAIKAYAITSLNPSLSLARSPRDLFYLVGPSARLCFDQTMLQKGLEDLSYDYTIRAQKLFTDADQTLAPLRGPNVHQLENFHRFLFAARDPAAPQTVPFFFSTFVTRYYVPTLWLERIIYKAFRNIDHLERMRQYDDFAPFVTWDGCYKQV